MSKAKSNIDKIIDKPCEELHEVKNLSGDELENDIKFSIDNPCQEILKEKYMIRAKIDIDMKAPQNKSFAKTDHGKTIYFSKKSTLSNFPP